VAAPPKPKEHSGQSGAEAIALLGLLQEHGRLVDFASEDISGADDADLGPAARVVHAGCSKVLREYFTIESIRAEAEGANVTLDAGCDMASHRLLGSVPDQPPYEGVLVHPGWKATEVRLPQVVAGKSESSENVIAPAEIQIKC
jgi:hypothetical protein